MQFEDRGANVADHTLQFIDGVGEARLHLRRAGPRDRALQGQTRGEQSLDDMVVQVAGDPFAVGDHVEFAHPMLGAGQLPGQGRLIGESRHHRQLLVGELPGAPVSHGHHHAGDGLGRTQRQDHRGAGVVDQLREVRRSADPARCAGDESGPDRCGSHG